jgi:hypothetical protein
MTKRLATNACPPGSIACVRNSPWQNKRGQQKRAAEQPSDFGCTCERSARFHRLAARRQDAVFPSRRRSLITVNVTRSRYRRPCSSAMKSGATPTPAPWGKGDGPGRLGICSSWNHPTRLCASVKAIAAAIAEKGDEDEPRP